MAEKKNKRKGLVFSIVFHLFILVVFSLYGLSYPVPRPEQGILINFGNSNVGSGTVQPDNPAPAEENNPDPPSESTPTPTVENPVSEEHIATTDEAPIEVEQKEPEETEEAQESTQETIEEPVEKERELDEALKNVLSNPFAKSGGGSEGDDADETGDKGSLEGSKNADSYVGGGQETATLTV